MIASRFFTQISDSINNQFSSPKPLSKYFEKKAIVVLGDPGSGKTTSFKEASSLEPNARYESIRHFLVLALDNFKDKILYLDGLDEQRAKTADGSAIIDKVIGRLAELGNPSFRLSCRSADWYGTSDEESLRKVTKDGQITVLKIEPLEEKEILEIAGEEIENPQEFLEKAKQKGIYDLLTNPQTLIMILTVYKDEKGFPETRKGLYQKCCEILAREMNEEHQRMARCLNQGEILDLAGYLCAIQLCANVEGFSRSLPAALDEFPYVGNLDNDSDRLGEVICRNIFCEESAERQIPAHRSISEFLAARYFAQKVREGVSTNKVLSFLTGRDGSSLSDLRGILAWLPCLCPEKGSEFLKIDPFGIILYGDVSELPTNLKKELVYKIIDLSDEDPWFRYSNWSPEPFGRLSCPELEPLFIHILDSPSRNPIIDSCILDAIAHGQPLPDMESTLEKLIRDPSRNYDHRVHALKALIYINSGEIETFLKLLDEIHSSLIPDQEGRLRGILLNFLYPQNLGAERIIDYFIDRPSENVFGYEYDGFIYRKLLEKTDDEHLPTLLDTVCKSKFKELKIDRYPFQDFIGQLMSSAIDKYGDKVEINRLYNWLDSGVGKYDSILNEASHKKVSAWLEDRPQKVVELVEYWLTKTKMEHTYSEFSFLRKRLCIINFPLEVGQMFLEKAERASGQTKGEFMFSLAVQLRTHYGYEDSPTFNELKSFVIRNPQYEKLLESAPISGEELEISLEAIKYKEESEQRRTHNIETLKKEIDGIRSGSNFGCLDFLSQFYFNIFQEFDEELSPLDRLTNYAGFEVAMAAQEGFISLLKRTDVYSPSEIGKKACESKRFNMSHVVLAGMDLLSKNNGEKISKLPRKTLQSAIAFRFAHSLNEEFKWADEIFINDPTLAAEALVDLWEPQFDLSRDSIDGLYELEDRSSMKGVGKLIVPGLLKEYPQCHERPLKYLLNFALNNLDREILSKIASDILSRSGLREESKIIWLGVAFLLDPEMYLKDLRKEVCRDKEKISYLQKFFKPNFKLFNFSSSTLANLVELFGGEFTPIDPGAEGWDTELGRISDFVRSLIDKMSKTPGIPSGQALISLKNNEDLEAWRENLQNAIFVQKQISRESEFKYPSVEDIVQKLHSLEDLKKESLGDLIEWKLPTAGYLPSIDIKMVIKRIWKWFINKLKD